MSDGDATRQYATFFVGGSYYGIEVQQVQEVLYEQRTTPVPLTSADVSGLINLRGQIVTAIDLRRRLGIRSRNPSDHEYVVVIRTPTGPLSLVVDSIGDVVTVDPNTIEMPPATLRGDARSLVLGVHLLDSQILQVLNVDRLLALVAA